MNVIYRGFNQVHIEKSPRLTKKSTPSGVGDEDETAFTQSSAPSLYFLVSPRAHFRFSPK